MNSIVGFCVHDFSSGLHSDRVNSSLDRALRHFPWLKRTSLKVGEACLDLWGHGDLSSKVYRLHGGSVLVLVGSPVGEVVWPKVEERLAHTALLENFVPPWEGCFVLLKIDVNSHRWTMWNDWNGSIPVFHAQVGQGCIASTLEPVVVAAAGYTPNDFFLPGLVSLLINGHYLGDWTLFKGMKVVPPDCVAEWDGQGFRRKRLWTVKPSDARWDRGWDELVDEMHELSRQAIADVLKTQPSWILPLSGGLDSRLIAAVGTEIGTKLHAFTYGHADWIETIHARQVAQTLGVPWQRVPIEPDYLVRYTQMWLEWFGSALHCHGMYQMPFLGHVENISLPIVTGFIGDPLAGAQTKGMCKDDRRPLLQRLVDKWKMWDVDDALAVLNIEDNSALDEIHAELQSQYDSISGAFFQKVWLIFEWSHVFGFSYYQPMMYAYWKGCGTPYVNAKYARFTLSLPRLALEDRLLQKEMLRRYYPKIAAIGGTFGGPLIRTKSYLVKGAIAWVLPRFMRKGPLQEFASTGNTMQINALRAFGEEALWPLNLNNVRRSLYDWFKRDMLEQTYQQAAAGDEAAYDRLRPIQAVAWHFLRDGA